MSFTDRCAVCGQSHAEMPIVLDYGPMPLVNALHADHRSAVAAPRRPLRLRRCPVCRTMGLRDNVPPGEMFDLYAYRSSMSRTYVAHCRDLAAECAARWRLRPGDTVLDIAGNDGALLGAFASVVPIVPVNVEPAANLAEISRRSGIMTVNEYWPAKGLALPQPPKIVTATNVLAHVPDPLGFLAACREAMGSESTLVVEVPDLAALLDGLEFDTVYHEHRHYFHAAALADLCEDAGLTVVDMARLPIHGGTIRIAAARNDAGRVPFADPTFLATDRRILDGSYPWDEAAAAYVRGLDALRGALGDLAGMGSRVWGFGAAAKACVRLVGAGVGRHLMEAVVDETPEKIGRWQPGTGIPVVGQEAFERVRPDVVVVLAWNFFEEIAAKLRAVLDERTRIVSVADLALPAADEIAA